MGLEFSLLSCMPSARLHTEGNPLLIINKFPWHWLLINLLFSSSNYFCLFKLTVSFPHLSWVSCRKCCMAKCDFSLFPDPLKSLLCAWTLKPIWASCKEWLASPWICTSLKLWYMLLQASEVQLSEEISRKHKFPCVVPWKAPKSHKESSSWKSKGCRSPHRKWGFP